MACTSIQGLQGIRGIFHTEAVKVSILFALPYKHAKWVSDLLRRVGVVSIEKPRVNGI